MNLYMITRTDEWDYDEYDSVVVVAEDSDQALSLVTERITDDPNSFYYNRSGFSGFKVDGSNLVVDEIGIATQDTHSGVVLSSFNAG